LAAAGATLGASNAFAVDPSGEWMVADHSARIHIESCADGYWGSIAWERQPGVDSKNPDPKKRGRPLLGAPILLSMKPADDSNKWEGKVYNPKDGGYYSASIQLAGPNSLRLEGCMLIFCSGETWTRAPEPKATTGAAAAAKAPKATTGVAGTTRAPKPTAGAAAAPKASSVCPR
jgi:uncharacterized protein (DUF2147 family)